MGFGIRRKLIALNTWGSVLHARMLSGILNFAHVVAYLQSVDQLSTMAILRHYGAQLAPDCVVESGLAVHNADEGFQNLLVESQAHVGQGALLDLKAPIRILRGSTIAMRSTIVTHFDPGKSPMLGPRHVKEAKPVSIGPFAYVGASATILAGVTIGEGSIVGAGALVNRDVPPHTVVAGVPARIIGTVCSPAEVGIQCQPASVQEGLPVSPSSPGT